MVFPAPNSNIPSVPQLTVERERLLRQIQLVIHHKITLIVAPPGYGKTTLVAQFARQTNYPVVWHLLEERERDIPNLVEHCLNSLSTLTIDLKSLQVPNGLAPSELALFVSDQLRSSIESDFVYVMDDIHHLLGTPGAEKWLQTFVTNIPPKCHLVLMGRALPVLSLTDMIARREVLALGQEQLRFTFDEVSELAQEAGKQLSPPEIQHIISRLDGWPAGTLLAIQPLPTELEAIVFAGAQAPEALFDALAQILLSAQSTALQEFLLASSTLTQMSPALCQDALQLENSLDFINQALNQNLFISQISGGLVYHSLFRDFLQRQLEANEPTHFVDLHVRAGYWFEANNRLDEAFEHYISAHRLNDAAKIAERGAQLYWSQGKAETVLRWRRELSSVVDTIPQLAKTCAMIHMDHYEYDTASTELAEAMTGLRLLNNELEIKKVVLLQATIDNFRGEYWRAIEQAQPIANPSSVPPNLYGFALATLGTSYLNLGDFGTALTYLETALPLWRETVDLKTLSQWLLTMEVTYRRSGRVEEATKYLLEVVEIRRALGSPAGLVMVLNNLGYHYHLLGQYQAAQLTFQEGLQAATRVPERRSESYLLWSMGDLQRDRSDFDEADSYYSRALQQIGTSEPLLRCGVLTSLSVLRRWEGRFEEAQTVAQESISLAENHQLGIEHLKAKVVFEANRAHLSDSKLAVQELEQLAEELFKRHAESRAAQTLGLCAHLALQHSDIANAHQYLNRAIKSVTHPANLQPLIAEIFHLLILKTHVLNHPKEYDVLHKGLRDLQTAQVERPIEVTNQKKSNILPTLSVRVQALGQERVERDGKLVSISAWQAAGARKLFSYLLFNGAATYDQIGLAFWPDSSPEQIRMKFHATLRRVRGAVGTNVIIFEDDLYRINPNIDLGCDVYEFEALVHQARLSIPLAPQTETLWRRAVELYQGDLLPSVDADWVFQYRASLREKYLEALIAAGNCARVRNNTQEAIKIFKQAINLDAYREDIYQALFLCYAQSGKRALIPPKLQELTTLLQAELGVYPSAETLTLVNTLLN
jgi:LuxR family maltose regulon positive regulatory protein